MALTADWANATSASTSGTSSSISLAYPTGCTAGDLVVVFYGATSLGSQWVHSIDAAHDWWQIARTSFLESIGQFETGGIWAHWCDGTETGNMTIVMDSDEWVMVAVRISGAHRSYPIIGCVVHEDAATGTLEVPDLGEHVIAFFVDDASGDRAFSSGTPSSGWTDRGYFTRSGSGPYLNLFTCDPTGEATVQVTADGGAGKTFLLAIAPDEYTVETDYSQWNVLHRPFQGTVTITDASTTPVVTVDGSHLDASTDYIVYGRMSMTAQTNCGLLPSMIYDGGADLIPTDYHAQGEGGYNLGATGYWHGTFTTGATPGDLVVELTTAPNTAPTFDDVFMEYGGDLLLIPIPSDMDTDIWLTAETDNRASPVALPSTADGTVQTSVVLPSGSGDWLIFGYVELWSAVNPNDPDGNVVAGVQEDTVEQVRYGVTNSAAASGGNPQDQATGTWFVYLAAAATGKTITVEPYELSQGPDPWDHNYTHLFAINLDGLAEASASSEATDNSSLVNDTYTAIHTQAHTPSVDGPILAVTGTGWCQDQAVALYESDHVIGRTGTYFDAQDVKFGERYRGYFTNTNDWHNITSNYATGAPSIGLRVVPAAPNVAQTWGHWIDADVSTINYQGNENTVAVLSLLYTPVASVPDATVQIEFAFGYGPFETATWTDVTSYVRSWSFRRGRSQRLNEVQAGQLSVVLSNADRRFDPLFLTGTYAPNVKVAVPVRVVGGYDGTAYTIFQGIVESWDQAYPHVGKDAICTVVAVDYTKLLALWEVTPNYSSEATEDFIDDVLDDTDWPAGTDWRNLETGGLTLAAYNPGSVESALSAIRKAVHSEGGAFFMAKDGKARFLDRTYWIGQTIAATFGQGVGELDFSAVDVKYNDKLLFTRVTVSRGTGTDQTRVAGSSSIAAFGDRALTWSAPLLTTDAAANALAGTILSGYRRPWVRVEQMTFLCPWEATTDDHWTEMLARDIGDAINVKIQHDLGMDRDYDLYVEGIQIGQPRSRAPIEVTWNLSTANETGNAFWILGTSDLDAGTILGR